MTRIRHQPPHPEQGAILILALVVSLVLLSIGVTTTWLANQRSHVTGSITRRAEAHQAALAGLERASVVLALAASWDLTLNGCGGQPFLAGKGRNLCAGGAVALVDQQIIQTGSVSDAESPASGLISYTLWIRNDDEEGQATPDTDNRVIVRSEGRARDGMSMVALETVFALIVSGEGQHTKMPQKGGGPTGASSGRARIASQY